MTLALERLEAEALELSTTDRASLAHRLIASLDEGLDDDPTEVELAWEAEISRRLDAYHRGEMKPIPSSEVFAKARALLR